MKKLTITPKQRILLAVVLYILWIISFVYFNAIHGKETLYRHIDQQLEDAALVTPLLLPPALHHQGMKKDDITTEQSFNHIQSLSALTDQQDIIYLYTLILRDNKVFFTSSSATREERETGENLSFYFDHYDDVDPRVFAIFEHKEKTFLEYTDQWGTFRSVFIPLYSTDGTFYLAGADLSISHIEALLNQQIYRSLTIAALFLLFAYPLYRVATSRLTNLTKELNQTVQRQTAELRLSEERLSHAMSSAHQSWFDVDLLTGKVEVSDQFPKLLGIVPMPLKFNIKLWQRNIHPDDRDNVLSLFDECLKMGEPNVAEYRIKTATGNWQWLHSVGQVIEWNKDNKPSRMVGIHRNITAQKRSDLVLQALAETGESAENDIFKTIVRQLALAHDMRYAFLAKLNEENNTQVNTIAVWENGRFGENFNYSLIGTPCATVTNDDDTVNFWPNNIQQLFPEDSMLVDMEAESYIGVALKNHAGKTIGLLSMLDDKPMSNHLSTLNLLKSLAVRATIEIERVESIAEGERITAALHEHQVRVLKNQQVLLNLAKQIFTDQNDAFAKIMTVSAQQLTLSRVSVWLFNEDNSAIIRQSLYNDGELSTEALTFEAKNYPRYFEVLNSSGFISADDALSHPSTQEFSEDYLIPLDITSMLDTPIRIQGKVIGITCFEQVGLKRKWIIEDEKFAASISELCAQIILDNDRQQAEEKLRDSEHRLRLSQLYGGIGTWETDLITKREVWSEAVTQQLGFPDLAEPTRDDFLEAIYPDDREHVNKIVEQHLEQGTELAVDYRIIDTQGNLRWMRSIGQVEFNSAGKPIKMMGTIQEITQQKLAENKLSFMAHYDVLTRLPNRVLFADRFKQAVAHSNRTNNMLAICFLDLDNFKPVNDDFGHDAGDQLLIEVAKRIKVTIREEDTLSRQGGDEFVLLLGNIGSYAQCKQLLNRIGTALTQPYLIDGYPVNISASIGATIYPLDDADLDTLIRHADHAMYQAKLGGKNQQQFFSTLDDQQTVRKQTQFEEIKRALANDEFCLYYQPKVNMKTGKVFGAEALIRWIHPEKGLIPPLDFLPLIEDTDLEIQIGGWVINQAMQQLDTWQRQGIKLEVSINISSHHLQSATFFNQLNDSFDQHPYVNSQDLQLEILESSALGDLDAISAIIKNCQNVLGVNVALDDFGTGYSSLTHLRNLSANTIKIDQTFVRDLLDDPDDYSIIKGVIGLARAFNREIVAEGVETDAHGLMLLIMGCDEAQGYGISRPMPAADIPAWLADYTPNQQWTDYAQQDLTLQQHKIFLLQLTTEHWFKNITTLLLTSENSGLEKYFVKCHLRAWLTRFEQEKIFDQAWLESFKPVHEEMCNLASELVKKHKAGDVDAARDGLSDLKVTYQKMCQLLQAQANS